MDIMRWALLWIVLAMNAPAWGATNQDNDAPLYGRPFKVAGLSFTIPYKWQSVPVENSNRAGQWHVPLPHSESSEGAEVAVFFFGPGVGGGVKENITAWNGLVLDSQGNPAAAKVSTLTAGGFKITVVSIFGTYEQLVTLPGLPPLAKPKFGLLGAVVETPQGNIYWRLTGPETLVTATIPLFNKIVASVKPQDKP
jgi:hypothetical protein